MGKKNETVGKRREGKVGKGLLLWRGRKWKGGEGKERRKREREGRGRARTGAPTTDSLRRLCSEIIYYVSSGTLNLTN